MSADKQQPMHLKVAVCLFPEVTALDYQGPVELLGFLAPAELARTNRQSRATFELVYLAPTLEPVAPTSGPRFVPDLTYGSAVDQFDVLLVPGGQGARPENVPDEVVAFLKAQAPKARYVLSVCTGSWILAKAGLLEGKRATTNKYCFKQIKAHTSPNIEWVAKARWVVDGKTWTASGVTAGIDMANAFIVHVAGEDVARTVRGIVEQSVKEESDDEFAAVYGLV